MLMCVICYNCVRCFLPGDFVNVCSYVIYDGCVVMFVYVGQPFVSELFKSVFDGGEVCELPECVVGDAWEAEGLSDV